MSGSVNQKTSDQQASAMVISTIVAQTIDDCDLLQDQLDQRYQARHRIVPQGRQASFNHRSVAIKSPDVLLMKVATSGYNIAVQGCDWISYTLPLGGQMKVRNKRHELDMKCGEYGALFLRRDVEIARVDGYRGCMLSVRRKRLMDGLADHGESKSHMWNCLDQGLAVSGIYLSALCRSMRFACAELSQLNSGTMIKSGALLDLLIGAMTQPFTADMPDEQPERRRTKRVEEFLREHYNEPLTLAALARVAGVSGRSLQLAFQRHLGVSPMSYLRNLRLAQARDLLLSTETPSIANVAYRCGFSSQSRFAHDYKLEFGETPSTTLHGHQQA